MSQAKRRFGVVVVPFSTNVSGETPVLVHGGDHHVRRDLDDDDDLCLRFEPQLPFAVQAFFFELPASSRLLSSSSLRVSFLP